MKKTLLPTLLTTHKCPCREQDHSLLQQHPTRWDSAHTSAGTAGFQPVPAEMDSAEQEGCGAAQAKLVGTMMEILMGGR